MTDTISKTSVVVSVGGVSKSFKLPHEQASGIKQLLVNSLKGKKGYEIQHVISDIDFEIRKGEFFGIVGKNGSGKSTLLKLIAGIYVPEKGNIKIDGSLTPFIELGVGFNPELTGRENVFLNGALLGFDRKEIAEMYEGIVEFAELEKFMDQKLKNYSSGMQVRLAFSIAIRAKSDILLIDEVLAVGDAAFQAKCFDYFYELRKSDTTVIFISHDRGALERFCTRGILIDDGHIIESGNIEKVLKRYNDVVINQMDNELLADGDASYDANIELRSIELHSSKGRIKTADFNDSLKVAIEVYFKEEAKNPILGITLWKRGMEKYAVYAANNITEGLGEMGHVQAGSVVRFEIDLPQLINDGEYDIEVGVANESATKFMLQEHRALSFKIFGSKNPHAIMATPGNMKLERK